MRPETPKQAIQRTASKDASRAVGSLAVGAVAVGRLVVGRARIRRLEIDELVVRRLRVTDELTVPPESDGKT